MISIVIPCFNQAHFLAECIDSVLNQTYEDWEVLIIDDGSTDHTREVAIDFANLDSRIHYLYQTNSGLSSARNFGIVNSKGNYLLFLDADDCISDNYFESILPFLSENVDIVFSGYCYFTEKNNVLHSNILDANLDFSIIKNANFIPVHSVVVKASFLKHTGMFDVHLKSAEDWDLWIRFYRHNAKYAVNRNITALYRICQNSMSRNFEIMYHSLITVFFRAQQDPNCNSYSDNLNFDISYSNNLHLKRILLNCIGVAVFQNRIYDAIHIFNIESQRFKFSFTSNDFKSMCTYLSFRYMNTREEVFWVLNTLRPRFSVFLNELNLLDLDKKDALKSIFSIHNKKYIRYKWKGLSPLINYFND